MAREVTGDRIGFPLTKVEVAFGRTGLHARRRTEGTPVAGSDAVDGLLAAAREVLPGSLREPASARMRVAYLAGHDCLGDTGPGTDAPWRFDADVAELVADRPGGAELYAMALAHLTAAAEGDEAEAIEAMLDVFLALPGSRQTEVRDLLAIEGLDANGLLGRFLSDAATADERERRRLSAWLRGRLRAETPYDGARVRRAIAESRDLDSLRTRTFSVIRETFELAIDNAHAERIADECLEQGRRLVGGRFSRALYIEGLLLAGARRVQTDHLRAAVAELSSCLDDPTLGLRHPALAPHAERLAELWPEVQRLANLAAGEWASLAEIDGALAALRESLARLESDLARAIDEAEADEAGAGGAPNRPRAAPPEGRLGTHQALLGPPLAAPPGGDRALVRQRLDDIRATALRIRSAAALAPSESPACVVFFQRMTPHGTVSMALLNEARDPFFGEDPEVHDLLLDGGHNLYTTPNLSAWLRRCDDWIEALPAYASYTIQPRESGYDVQAWVQRGAMEDLFRRHAEDWALNIEHVMDLEHVALARALVAGWLDLQDEVALAAEAEGLATEEAIRRLLRERAADGLVGGMAALVERSYRGLCAEVARCRAREELPRREALARVLRESEAPDNLVRRAMTGVHPTGEALASSVAEILEEHDLSDRAAHLRPLAMKRRRELPAVHVLTTLGPGETELNIADWLEESMALFCVSRAHGLEAHVAERVATRREQLCAIGQALVEEMDLHAELLDRMRDDGLDPDVPADRERGVLALLASVPEVGEVAARRFSAGPNADFSRLTDEAWATLAARKELIEESGLSSALNDPRFRYDSTGPYKAYNLLYTPSRVDLGLHEVRSVRDIPKWIGGADAEAAAAGARLYALHIVGGPRALPSPRIAEFMKVGENFFSRGGVFYLSLAAGVNIDTLGIGDFEQFRDEWNRRGDRTVLPTGETYGGFCVPKEFSLLFAVITGALRATTSDRILDVLAIPAERRQEARAELRRLLRMRLDCADEVEWEERAAEGLSAMAERLGGGPAPVRLAHLAKARPTIAGVTGEGPADLTLRLANWASKKTLGLEEINRIGPFRKVHLIRRLLERARDQRSGVADDVDVIGVMTASYKEGERSGDRDIPVNDVRFSAGARKLEIYAGTAFDHLLADIDPEGRDLVRELFDGFVSPADVRMVGSCTATDVLGYVPNSGLPAGMERAREVLLRAGIGENLMAANSAVYGADLRRWAGIRELTAGARAELLREVGDARHLVALAARGPFRSYEEAVQGVDFLDLGIPDPALLDLVDDLPRLVHLMQRGRPGSALVLADGTSGARRRTFSFRYASGKRKVQELLALEPLAAYGSLGLGDETIGMWRDEMAILRDLAWRLFESLTTSSVEQVHAAYGALVRAALRYRLADEAVDDEAAARQHGVRMEPYRLRSKALGRVDHGLPASALDFGTWLLLGGAFALSGRCTEEELAEARRAFESVVALLPRGIRPAGLLSPSFVEAVIREFWRPACSARPLETAAEVDTGVSGSLKAAEERETRLARREVRKRMAQRALLLQRRARAYATEPFLKSASLQEAHASALQAIGDPCATPSPEDVGRFIARAAQVFHLLRLGLEAAGRELPGLTRAIDRTLAGGEITVEGHRALAECALRAVEPLAADRGQLEDVAMALELLDIALAVEMVGDAEGTHGRMLAVARFLDATLNNHIFDCIPYHYHAERSAAFESLSRDARLDLAVRRHQWLYRYLRHRLVAQTQIADRGSDYADQWLGDWGRNVVPVGVGADLPWFLYARLRDAAALCHEGYPLPELLLDLDPLALLCDERANVVIVYPHGNTTVPVALEQGPRLGADERVNLMLCAWPELCENDGEWTLRAPDAFLFLCREDYRRALVSLGTPADEVERRAGGVGEGGVLVAARFTRLVVAHAVFCHFTHPRHLEIDSIRAPLLQPLVWEAATHLKCRLPDMLRGSGTCTAPQANWYRTDAVRMGEPEARQHVAGLIRDMARRYDRLIVKPEKESGGRHSRLLPVRDGDALVEGNIEQLVDLACGIAKTDNAVIQQALESHVRRLYAPEFLDGMVARFARLGVPVLLDREPQTPLFSYFRLVLVRDNGGYEVTHNITVVSTRGVANVGQGGLLYEYTDDIIAPRYRADLREAMTEAAFGALETQQAYIAEHWQEVLDEYLQAHPEYGDPVSRPRGEVPDCSIPYEMGDFMPVFLVDEDDCLTYVFDPEVGDRVPLFDAQTGEPLDVPITLPSGEPVPRRAADGTPLRLPMLDQAGAPILRYDAHGRRIRTLHCYKIEANPGAGLWRPHNDQLPPERKGEGVYAIFRALGRRAHAYWRRLASGE